MASLIAIPFLIGSVPLGLAVVGANHFLKDKRKTNKFLYWGGITASAFGGWVVSNMLMKRYLRANPSNYWDNMNDDDFKGMYQFYKEVPVGWEIDYPGLTFNEYKKQVMKRRDPINVPISMIYEDMGDGFGAESKFKEPYMKGDKIDMKRGNDGRFRRRLVIPLEKNADTSSATPQYFYRWIGGSSGNPIYYGYSSSVIGREFASLVHYVHPIYDEDYVKTLVDKLNLIQRKVLSRR